MNVTYDELAFEVGHGIELERLLEWASLIAAQIHDNLPFIRIHRQALLAKGELESRVNQIGIWRESTVFSARERAVLGLSEAISSDESEAEIHPLISEARRHLDSEQIVSLSARVMAVNHGMKLHGKGVIRVLVVEDNLDDQILLNRQLRKTSFRDQVLFLDDPRIALDLIQGPGCESFRKNLLAVFLDVNLPHLSGIDVLRTIRSTEGCEELPVIVMTTDGRPEVAAACEELKIKAFVTKPVTMNDFTRVIAPLFHRPRLTQSGKSRISIETETNSPNL